MKPLRYVLAIKQGVYGSQGAYLALQFAQSLLHSGNQIHQIFFFQYGVSNANTFAQPASDEINLTEKWKTLAESYRLPLHLCVSAAQRHGIIEENLATGFTLAGLGEFSRAVLEADRVLTF